MSNAREDHSHVVNGSRVAPGPVHVADLVGLADVLVGSAWGAARLSGRLAVGAARIAAPVVGVVLRPPLVPRGLQPAHGVHLLAARWQRDRPETLRALGRWSAAALPGAVNTALNQVDVNQVATVVLNRVNLTGIVSTVLERVDVNKVAEQLLNQLDLTQLVLDRVDLQRVVAAALEPLDLTAIVVDQVDLGAVVSAALDRLDLTSVVVDQVDLGRVVSAALQQVDLTEIVLHQVELIGVAEYVVEGIDLPQIIRDSTGSVASEAVVGMRMQGIDADVVVGRVVDRMLHRRRHGRTEEAPEQLTSADPPPDAPVRESS
jgi:hypothetical protein